MSAPVQQATDIPGAITPEHQCRPKRRTRTLALAAAAVVIAGGGLALGVTGPFHRSQAPPSAGADPTSRYPVTRQALSSQTTVNGTLGYAGSYTVVVPAADGPGQAAGTFTALPAIGQVVHQGQSAYAVSGSPVALLYGAVPAYRSLSEGMSGADVRQLNADLIALGDANRTGLDPGSDYFSADTAAALDKLQSGLGLAQTGSLPLGQAVFLPTAIEVGSVSATLGAPVQPGAAVLQGTSTARQVTAQIDATQQPEVTPGARVSIVLPDGATTPGVVTAVGTVASVAPGSSTGSPSSGNPDSSGNSGGSGAGPATIDVDIRLSDPAAAGTLDQAPVQVNITAATVHDALVVPIDALLAQPAGYAVEVAGANGTRHLVPVSLGLFDDAAGLVQVSGRGLAAGQQVVVPQI
ncbi:MAG TPA: hypothetical protein VIX15_15920 [Streptosporangiaceae bacterium]